eukprot:TRINITY_DN6404_c0_g1_i2.p1 TRINITY_DN6404_c0_g1~~TRINITY_DN6404_c0_g1_i2.p1  ORF type:complete len:292 (-),score=62.84 TRINITY_DN6404_c0_g1_i2:407-1282(-)
MNMSPTQQQQQIAEQLKEEGNKLFSMGKYQPAVDKYTEAITIVPSWTVPLVNRALCYKKLQKWDKVEEDAITALSNAENMKAHYLLGQALIQKQLFTEASKNLKKALELAREKGDSIKDDIWRELARAEYKAWQQASSARKAKLDRLKDRLKKGLALLHLEEENADMDVDKGESTQDEEDLEWLLSCAQERDEAEEPASAFTCQLTMEVFRDPVISPSGLSYEKSALLEHLNKVGKFDPITRDPMPPNEGGGYNLTPNYGLRAATQQYLDEHPWAWRDCIDAEFTFHKHKQ